MSSLLDSLHVIAPQAGRHPAIGVLGHDQVAEHQGIDVTLGYRSIDIEVNNQQRVVQIFGQVFHSGQIVAQQLDNESDDQFDQVQYPRVHAALLSMVKPVRYMQGLHLQCYGTKGEYLNPSVESSCGFSNSITDPTWYPHLLKDFSTNGEGIAFMVGRGLS